MFRRDRGDDFWYLGTHSLRTVAQIMCRWRSAVPQGRICATQWSCSCPGGGPQCLRDAFASYSEAVRVPVEVLIPDGVLWVTSQRMFLCTSLVRLCLKTSCDFAEIAEKFVDYGFFL